MNAQTFPPAPGLRQRSPASPRMARGQDRGSPGGIPPIEQRFTGPIGTPVDRGGANPFGPLPRVRKLQGQRFEGARSLITSNVNKAFAIILASSAIATYAIHAFNQASIVKINFIWPV